MPGLNKGSCYSNEKAHIDIDRGERDAVKMLSVYGCIGMFQCEGEKISCSQLIPPPYLLPHVTSPNYVP